MSKEILIEAQRIIEAHSIAGSRSQAPLISRGWGNRGWGNRDWGWAPQPLLMRGIYTSSCETAGSLSNLLSVRSGLCDLGLVDSTLRLGSDLEPAGLSSNTSNIYYIIINLNFFYYYFNNLLIIIN